MHISSLPSPYGIGTMGQAARDYADFLSASRQTYWQILPVCPTSFGDSPYQSFSTYAGNPYFIDLDDLARDGLLKEEEYAHLNWGSDPSKVDYHQMYVTRYPVLRLATQRFLEHPWGDYGHFCWEQGFWLNDYALFMALKDENNGAPWQQWPHDIRHREPQAMEAAYQRLEAQVNFWKVCQYLFFHQWWALKSYANDRGVKFIGDLPIYVAGDSVDVWANPHQFQLDDNLLPTDVAGCPPDGFSADGQLWGNPLFRWDVMEQDGYGWWVARIRALCNIYDLLRIDHFRGFDAYYAIPYGAPTAKEGEWRQGPGMKLFRRVEEVLGRKPIIAEDLGFLTDSVHQLLRDSGFPGMKVLEFAFDSRDGGSNLYLPHNYFPHCIAYTGTHDNETAVGWLTTGDPDDVQFAKEYLGLSEEEGYHWGFMRGVWGSNADLAMVQMQDVLGLDNSARMNTPSTLGCNWMWRALPGSYDADLAAKLAQKMHHYGR